MTYPANDAEWYRRTLDSLIEGFQIIARDWTYVYVNPVAAGHGRTTPGALIGQRMWDVYPDIRESEVFGVLSRAMTERTSETIETLFTFPDGVTRWFEVRVSPVPEGICIQSLDIQARKDVEAAHREVEQRLQEQAALVSIGEMAAVVSHEVKNPLAAVRGAIEVIGGRVGPSDARIVKEVIARIDGLTDLMKDLLLFARPPRPRIVAVDPAAIFGRVIDLLRHDPAAKEMTVAVTGSSPPIAADPDLLSAVFLNLLLNAVQATGGRGRIAIGLGSRDRFGVVEIADDGPGIPDAVRLKLFRPFFSTKPGGSGLGLATARRILEEHGGTIAIESPDGGGTRVVVQVPVAGGA